MRSEKIDEEGDYRYVKVSKSYGLEIPTYDTFKIAYANWFATRMDAELWTTNGYKVVEIDGDGKEVTE